MIKVVVVAPCGMPSCKGWQKPNENVFAVCSSRIFRKTSVIPMTANQANPPPTTSTFLLYNDDNDDDNDDDDEDDEDDEDEELLLGATLVLTMHKGCVKARAKREKGTSLSEWVRFMVLRALGFRF